MARLDCERLTRASLASDEYRVIGFNAPDPAAMSYNRTVLAAPGYANGFAGRISSRGTEEGRPHESGPADRSHRSPPFSSA